MTDLRNAFVTLYKTDNVELLRASSRSSALELQQLVGRRRSAHLLLLQCGPCEEAHNGPRRREPSGLFASPSLCLIAQVNCRSQPRDAVHNIIYQLISPFWKLLFSGVCVLLGIKGRGGCVLNIPVSPAGARPLHTGSLFFVSFTSATITSVFTIFIF